MSKNSNEKKSKQLGMNHSTAQGRLKKPWLDEDTRLFWDMGNIAFSHRSCNSSAARFNTKGGRKKFEKRIGNREDEDGHYVSRTWYDRGCRCDGCKAVKSLTRRNHERKK